MLTAEWLRAFGAVGVFKGGSSFVPAGAGVFFHHEGLLWIITANHVLKLAGQQSLSVLVGQAIGDHPTVVNLAELQEHLGISWVIDEVNDIAASLMPYSPEVNIKALTAQNLLGFSEVTPSMPCYTIGYPYGFRGVDPQSSLPLLLDGIISGANKSTKEIYTSAATFPGNSGGPLIAIRSPFNPSGAMAVGRPTVFLAGIVLRVETIAPQLPANQFSLRNLHLGVAKSTDVVIELLKSEKAQAQVRVALATKS